MSATVSTVSPSICHEVMGPDAMIVFWMLSFKPTFSLFSFTFIKRLFSYSLLSAIRVVLSAYLRLLTFLPAILIPACTSSSPAFLMMYSAYKLKKQGDNIQPWLEKVAEYFLNALKKKKELLTKNSRPSETTLQECCKSIQAATTKHDKMSGSIINIQQKFTSHSSGAGNPKIRVPTWLRWGPSSRSQTSHCIITWQKRSKWGLLGASFVTALIPLMGSPPWPKNIPKDLIPNTIMLRISISTFTF